MSRYDDWKAHDPREDEDDERDDEDEGPDPDDWRGRQIERETINGH